MNKQRKTEHLVYDPTPRLTVLVVQFLVIIYGVKPWVKEIITRTFKSVSLLQDLGNLQGT